MKQPIMMIIAIAFVALAVDCKKDKPEPKGGDPFVEGESVFVLSEGNFMSGNGSIAHYNKVDQKVRNRVFQNVNGSSLGDVVQSMTIHNGKGYIVVNNSQKVEVVGLDSLQQVGVITGLTSPRVLYSVQNNKAYISDLHADSVAVVNLQNEQITGYIAIKGFTGEMAGNSHFVFIANNADDYVYVVDPARDSVVGRVDLLAGNKSLTKDAQGDIWVLCSGDDNSNINGKLYELNGSDYTINKEFEFSEAQFSPELTANGTGDTLFFRFGDVYKMATAATALPSNALITQGSRSLYALGVDPASSEIYLGDAGNFSDDGSVFRYHANGQMIDSFKVGVGPGHFQFY